MSGSGHHFCSPSDLEFTAKRIKRYGYKAPGWQLVVRAPIMTQESHTAPVNVQPDLHLEHSVHSRYHYGKEYPKDQTNNEVNGEKMKVTSSRHGSYKPDQMQDGNIFLTDKTTVDNIPFEGTFMDTYGHLGHHPENRQGETRHQFIDEVKTHRGKVNTMTKEKRNHMDDKMKPQIKTLRHREKSLDFADHKPKSSLYRQNTFTEDESFKKMDRIIAEKLFHHFEEDDYRKSPQENTRIKKAPRRKNPQRVYLSQQDVKFAMETFQAALDVFYRSLEFEQIEDGHSITDKRNEKGNMLEKFMKRRSAPNLRESHSPFSYMEEKDLKEMDHLIADKIKHYIKNDGNHIPGRGSENEVSNSDTHNKVLGKLGKKNVSLSTYSKRVYISNENVKAIVETFKVALDVFLSSLKIEPNAQRVPQIHENKSYHRKQMKNESANDEDKIDNNQEKGRFNRKRRSVPTVKMNKTTNFTESKYFKETESLKVNDNNKLKFVTSKTLAKIAELPTGRLEYASTNNEEQMLGGQLGDSSGRENVTLEFSERKEKTAHLRNGHHWVSKLNRILKQLVMQQSNDESVRDLNPNYSKRGSLSLFHDPPYSQEEKCRKMEQFLSMVQDLDRLSTANRNENYFSQLSKAILRATIRQSYKMMERDFEKTVKRELVECLHSWNGQNVTMIKLFSSFNKGYNKSFLKAHVQRKKFRHKETDKANVTSHSKHDKFMEFRTIQRNANKLALARQTKEVFRETSASAQPSFQDNKPQGFHFHPCVKCDPRRVNNQKVQSENIDNGRSQSMNLIQMPNTIITTENKQVQNHIGENNSTKESNKVSWWSNPSNKNVPNQERGEQTKEQSPWQHVYNDAPRPDASDFIYKHDNSNGASGRGKVIKETTMWTAPIPYLSFIFNKEEESAPADSSITISRTDEMQPQSGRSATGKEQRDRIVCIVHKLLRGWKFPPCDVKRPFSQQGNSMTSNSDLFYSKLRPTPMFSSTAEREVRPARYREMDRAESEETRRQSFSDVAANTRMLPDHNPLPFRSEEKPDPNFNFYGPALILLTSRSR